MEESIHERMKQWSEKHNPEGQVYVDDTGRSFNGPDALNNLLSVNIDDEKCPSEVTH